MVWFVGSWQFQLNQTEATASKNAKTTLRHPRASAFCVQRRLLSV